MDLKISQLPSATTPVVGTEVLPIVQSSTTKKVEISDLTAGRDTSVKSLTSSDLTASQLLSSNGSKVITSLDTATYPSLTEISYVKGVTSALQTQLNNKQGLDATLTALAAFNTNGIMVQTATDTFTARTITGTANQVVVSNGNGVSGNPTLSTPQDIATASSPTFSRLTLSQATGTAPLSVSSQTVVGNFNADLLDDQEGTYYRNASNINAGTLSVDHGGTGQTSYTNGQILIGNTTGNTLEKATITGTANQVSVSNGNGSITLSTPQDIGTGSGPTFGSLTISGGATFGTIGTLLDYSASSTIVGWAATPTVKIWYNLEGRVVTVWYSITGTSNATNANFTLPYTSVSSIDTYQPIAILVNNGTGEAGGYARVGPSGNIVNLGRLNDVNFTASGEKGVYGMLVYYKN